MNRMVKKHDCKGDESEYAKEEKAIFQAAEFTKKGFIALCKWARSKENKNPATGKPWLVKILLDDVLGLDEYTKSKKSIANAVNSIQQHMHSITIFAQHKSDAITPAMFKGADVIFIHAGMTTMGVDNIYKKGIVSQAACDNPKTFNRRFPQA